MIYALYECDAWKSYASMTPVVFSTKWKDITEAVKRNLKMGHFSFDGLEEDLNKGFSEGLVYDLNTRLENAFVSYSENGQDCGGVF